VDYSQAFNFTNFDANAGAGFSSFGGGVLSQPMHFNGDDGALELTPHNVVHRDVGGWMANPNFSARDPIFFLHHANVDRLWKRWRSTTSGQDPTSDTIWMNTKFTFFDENGQQVQLSGRDILDTVSELNYCYDDETACGGPPPPAKTIPMTLYIGGYWIILGGG
jgi:Common central domain of tyrosinase/Polyphenol oxidase middle domain